MLYLIGSAYRYYQLHSGDIWILDFIGIIHWRYYFFFVFGTLVKKYYSNFCQWMDNQYISAVIIILMVVVHFVVSRFFPIHQYNTVTFLIQGTLLLSLGGMKIPLVKLHSLENGCNILVDVLWIFIFYTISSCPGMWMD